MATKNLLTISQAAQLLQVSPDTLRNWEKQKILLPKRTPGNSRRYNLSEIKQTAKQKLSLPKKQYSLITISQAAKLLNLSADTLRNWKSQGIIKPLRTAGGSRRYTKNQILKLQKERGINLANFDNNFQQLLEKIAKLEKEVDQLKTATIKNLSKTF